MWILLALVAAAAALRIRDYIEGERLIGDAIEEWRISHADIVALDAAWLKNPNRSATIISMTTIPSRLPLIADTLKSLLRQRRAPAEIRLNLPAFSKREQCAYSVPSWLTDLKSVRIVPCEDWGPATKLIPSLLALPPDQAIVALDDDRLYPVTLIEDLDAAAARLPDAALGLSGWVAPADLIDRPTTLLNDILQRPPVPVKGTRLHAPRRVDILQGFSAYLVRPRFFELESVTDYSGAPEAAFFVDDVWLAAHCRAPKFVIPVSRSNFQSRRNGAFFKRTSLGLRNRGGGDLEKRNNTIVLRHFAPDWMASGSALDHAER